jgi:organic hydroperoxide reductase OsmC/OhrA
MDIYRSVDLEWHSAGEARIAAVPDGASPYAMPGPSCGGGVANPETLLIAAMASSYGATLSNVLRGSSLARTRICVSAEGVITTDLGKPRFTRVTVVPTIRGADPSRRDEYEKAAVTARDECLIGRSIRGNVAYVVGEVSLVEAAD